MGLTVDAHLRCVDIPFAETGTIAPLPLDIFPRAEWILPADIVPVINVKLEREHIRTLCQLAEKRLRRRAGRTALTGEQFDDDGRLGLRRRRRYEQGHAECRQPKAI